MPRNLNKTAVSGKAALPQISAKLLEELIPGPVTKEQFEDIFQNFKRAFIERALNAELSHPLGYGPGQAKPDGATNHRNGSSAKTVLTDSGSVHIDVPPGGDPAVACFAGQHCLNLCPLGITQKLSGHFADV